MNFRNFLSVFILIIFTTCKSSSNSTKKGDCYTYAIKNVNQIYEYKYTLKVKDQTKYFTQLGFCTHNPLVLEQIIYDVLGKWHKVIYEEETKKPLLIWENVYFDKIKSKINIISSSSYDSLSWVLIYNNNSFDFLSSESIHKKNIVEYFVKKINTNTEREKSGFYEEYYTEFYPKRWEEMMYYRKKNEN